MIKSVILCCLAWKDITNCCVRKMQVAECFFFYYLRLLKILSMHFHK